MTWPDNAPPGTVLPAWDFIGYDGDYFLRIVGGRAKYETAIYYDDTPGDRVKLARIDTGSLHQVNRYVDPDTPVEVVVTATKQTGNATLREVEGLATTTRVFACYQEGLNLGFLTADERANTVELVYVPDFLRGRGIATVLLDFARETTGLSLEYDTGERTLEGSAWARKQGLKIAPGHKYRRLGKRDIARQIAMLSVALMREP